MTQFEFYKSFQFVIELLLAEAMFVFRFRRRRFFWLLLPAAVILCFAFAWLMPVLSENPFYISCMFLLIFVFTVLMNKAVFRESWLTVSFGCVAGYTTQHLAYELYNIWLLAFQFPQDTGFYGSGAFVSVFTHARTSQCTSRSSWSSPRACARVRRSSSNPHSYSCSPFRCWWWT